MEVVECAKKVAQSLARHNTLCFPHTTVSAAVAPAGEDGGGEKELPFLQNTSRSSSAAFVAQRCSRDGNCQLFRYGTLCWVFLACTVYSTYETVESLSHPVLFLPVFSLPSPPPRFSGFVSPKASSSFSSPTPLVVAVVVHINSPPHFPRKKTNVKSPFDQMDKKCFSSQTSYVALFARNLNIFSTQNGRI